MKTKPTHIDLDLQLSKVKWTLVPLYGFEAVEQAEYELWRKDRIKVCPIHRDCGMVI